MDQFQDGNVPLTKEAIGGGRQCPDAEGGTELHFLGVRGVEVDQDEPRKNRSRRVLGGRLTTVHVATNGRAKLLRHVADARPHYSLPHEDDLRAPCGSACVRLREHLLTYPYK
jgi:hypothetical protein